jgi:hypothetical protein
VTHRSGDCAQSLRGGPKPVANVRWLIAAGIRDLQAMLDELAKLQKDLPRDAQHPTSPPTTTRAA